MWRGHAGPGQAAPRTHQTQPTPTRLHTGRQANKQTGRPFSLAGSDALQCADAQQVEALGHDPAGGLAQQQPALRLCRVQHVALRHEVSELDSDLRRDIISYVSVHASAYVCGQTESWAGWLTNPQSSKAGMHVNSM